MFSFGIKDIIDILIVALLLYTLYKMMKESGTISIFTGVLAFVGVWIVVTQILDMRLIGSIMDKFMSVGRYFVSRRNQALSRTTRVAQTMEILFQFLP